MTEPQPLPTRVLLVEDNPDDAELIVRALRDGDLAIEPRVVASEAELRAALTTFGPDLALVDWSVPGLSGAAAVTIAREWNASLPVILVSGAVGEMLVTHALRVKATDYVSKNRLAALAPAVRRALEEVDALRERARLEEEVTADQERLRTALDTMLVGVSVTTAMRDEEGRIFDFRLDYSNPAIGEISGVPASDYIGHSLLELFPAHRTNGLFDAYVRVVETGVPFESDDFHYVDPDAAGGPLDQMLENRAVKLGDGYLLSVLDMTERKTMEEALFVEKELAVVTLNSIGDAVISTDASGNITLLNVVAEKMTGWSSQEAAGRPVADVFHVLDATTRETVADAMQAAVRDNLTEHLPSNCLLVRRDGSEVAIADSVSPIHDRDGHVTGAVMVFRDVSEAREMALRMRAVDEELERSNRELDDFAAIASHDLQEPLRKIRAFGDRLAEHSSSALDEEARDYLRRMTDAASRMQTLIADLLEYSEVTIHPEPPQPVDLGPVVTDVLCDLDEGIRSSHGSVIVGSLPTVLASPLQMRQLFQNLIANALKFHPDGIAPEVHVEATARGDGGGMKRRRRGAPIWEISVRDNGIGFDEKYAERIFAPFQRLNGRQAFAGAGMGLAICRRIVTLRGGTITASSHPGAGATFLLTLPGVALGTQAGGRAG